MENSAYVPNSAHLNSPALVVFSQAAGGLQDALRIQRPFNPQFAMSEASKELHRPFSSSFGLRHMEAYGGLPAHILNHLQPQFLHPGLSLGSGAFRPLADLKAFPSPSAFAPPKCLKIETNSDANVHHGGSGGGSGGGGGGTGGAIFSPSEERFLGPSPRGTDSCSPASASMSPQPQTTVKEESLDAHMSEDGDGGHGQGADNDSPGVHDDARGFRIGPLFGGGFSAGGGGYTFSVPGLPPAAHALAKTSFLFDHGIRWQSNKDLPPIPSSAKAPPESTTKALDEICRMLLQYEPPVPIAPAETVTRPAQEIVETPRSMRTPSPTNLPRPPPTYWQALHQLSDSSMYLGLGGCGNTPLFHHPRYDPNEPHIDYIAFGPPREFMREQMFRPTRHYPYRPPNCLDPYQRFAAPMPFGPPMRPPFAHQGGFHLLPPMMAPRYGPPMFDNRGNWEPRRPHPWNSQFQPSGRFYNNHNGPRYQMPRQPMFGHPRVPSPSGDHARVHYWPQPIDNRPRGPLPLRVAPWAQEQPQRRFGTFSPNLQGIDLASRNLSPAREGINVSPMVWNENREVPPRMVSVLTYNGSPNRQVPPADAEQRDNHSDEDALVIDEDLKPQQREIILPKNFFNRNGLSNGHQNGDKDTEEQAYWDPAVEGYYSTSEVPNDGDSVTKTDGEIPAFTLTYLGTIEPKVEDKSDQDVKQDSPGTRYWESPDLSLKKKRDPSCCPICGMTISPGELEAHFGQELEVLCKISGTGLAASKKRRVEPGRPPALPGDSGPEGRWETFQRIKSNRQSRLRVKTRKRKADDGCMICIGRLHRTPEEMNMHVERCRKNSLNEEDETVDVEGDSELEEWAEHQRRNTLSSQQHQGIINSGNTIISTRLATHRDNDNEGDDVIVDGDDPEQSTFGPSQYTETDIVIKNSRSTPSERNNNGNNVTSNNNNNNNIKKDGQAQSQVATVNSSGDVEVTMEIIVESDSNVSTSDAEPSSRTQMIEELRNRIRPFTEGAGETATSTETEDYKCLICLEHYKKPVISTVCWHVHCEDCWLHALGSKNICPQCSMITSPTDLRRIFM